MKPAVLISLFVLVYSLTGFTQIDSAAIKAELRKEVKEMELFLVKFREKTAVLEKSVRDLDTLIFALKRKRAEVTQNLEELEQAGRYNEKVTGDIDTLKMDLTQSHIAIKKQLKSGKLLPHETEQAKKEIADIERDLREGSLRTDSLKTDAKTINARITGRKKELDWSGQELERIQSKHDASRQELDKANRLMAEIEAQIAEIKQVVDK